MRKNKILSLILSLAMSICLVCALSVPAYAVVAGDVNASATTEVVVESTQPIPVREQESGNATATVEEETDTTPLTPEGNSNLQDDSNSKNKEFITVQTKNGNYFYLVIDKDRADNNAYMLSQIDEGDLKEFLEEQEIQEPVTTIVEQPAEESQEEPEPEKQEPKGGMNGMTFLILAAAAGGGAFYYFKVLKPKQEQARGEQEIESAEFPDDVVEREDMDDTRVIMTHTPYAETGDEEVED
jgi:hypothetical protein